MGSIRLYYIRKSAGECVRCGGQPVAGKTLCAPCAFRGNQANFRLHQRQKKAKMESRLARDIARDPKIIRAYQNGFSHKDVARWHGMSSGNVMHILHEKGVSIRPPGSRTAPERHMMAMKVAAIDEYLAGYTLHEVGAKYGRSYATVRAWLRQASVPLRRKGTRSKIRGTDEAR